MRIFAIIREGFGEETVLIPAVDADAAQDDPACPHPSSVDQVVDFTDQIIALHDRLQVDRFNKAMDADDKVPWIDIGTVRMFGPFRITPDIPDENTVTVSFSNAFPHLQWDTPKTREQLLEAQLTRLNGAVAAGAKGKSLRRIIELNRQELEQFDAHAAKDEHNTFVANSKPATTFSIWSPWITWRGGDCPIPWAKDDEFQLTFRDSNVRQGEADATAYTWDRRDEGITCIISYRYRLAAAPEGFSL